MTQEKSYTVKEACELTGLSRALVSRLCSRGLIGEKQEFPLLGSHYYVLSSSDICFLVERKSNPPKNARKNLATQD